MLLPIVNVNHLLMGSGVTFKQVNASNVVSMTKQINVEHKFVTLLPINVDYAHPLLSVPVGWATFVIFRLAIVDARTTKGV